jgi:hypothetical protein
MANSILRGAQETAVLEELKMIEPEQPFYLDRQMMYSGSGLAC